MNKTFDLKPSTLKAVKETYVRFNEVDSLQLVWHGHYIRYFEDGREEFGKEHGLGYMDVYAKGYVTPVVRAVCDYKRPLKYGDDIRIETTFVNTPAAKLIFQYKIYKVATEELVATGETIQVFLDENGELMLTVPDFFAEWKERMVK